MTWQAPSLDGLLADEIRQGAERFRECDRALYRAEVYLPAHPYKSDRSDVPTHWGPTPALALCTAAIKARAA